MGFVGAPLIISILSAAVSLVSLGFAVYSWREANRPLVTARVTTESSGDFLISLNLLVENTGNRPAVDIRLIASETEVKAAAKQGIVPKDAERCFFSGVFIPVLANGRSISNGFWHLGMVDSWQAGAVLPLAIEYRDLHGRNFTSNLRLLLADDAGFAQTYWSSNTRT